MIRGLQTKHIFQNTTKNFTKLFKTGNKKKQKRQKWKKFSVIIIFQNSENQAELFEEDSTEKDLYNSLKSRLNVESSGNDGSTK